MLLDIFKEKRCFKLICAAGNEDTTEVEKLVALYSMAGCNFFDLCVKPEVIDAARRGIEKSGITKERYLCCSVGVKDDIHLSKAKIIKESCTNCGACMDVCQENAIINNRNSYEINKAKCIGCLRCMTSCDNSSIIIESEDKDFKEILPPIIKKEIDCIEFHIQGDDENEINEKWGELNNLYDGVLSICINRSKLGNEQVINKIKRLLKKRKPYTTIIQADGAPMSGGKDDYKTTLQAVAMAEIIQSANLPVYIIISGGTNSKSTKLASLCDVNIAGVAIGSYARKIVSEYIKREDFFENKEMFNKALLIAKNLVDISIKNINS